MPSSVVDIICELWIQKILHLYIYSRSTMHNVWYGVQSHYNKYQALCRVQYAGNSRLLVCFFSSSFFLLCSCSKSVSVYLHVTCIMRNTNCSTISVFIVIWNMNLYVNGFLALWIQTVRNWCMLNAVQRSNIIPGIKYIVENLPIFNSSLNLLAKTWTIFHRNELKIEIAWAKLSFVK